LPPQSLMHASANALETSRYGAEPGDAELVLILLHGHGEPGNSLEKFARSLLTICKVTEGPKLSVVLAQGPLAVSGGRGWWVAGAVDFSKDPANAPAKVQPPDALIQQLAETVKGELQFHEQAAVVLCGVHYGSALAVHAAARLRQEVSRIIGVAVVAGFADTSILQKAAEASPDPLYVFLAHGEDDDVVPEMVAHMAIANLREKMKFGTSFHLETYMHEGGHEVGDDTDDRIMRWITKMSVRGVNGRSTGSAGSARMRTSDQAIHPSEDLVVAKSRPGSVASSPSWVSPGRESSSRPMALGDRAPGAPSRRSGFSAFASKRSTLTPTSLANSSDTGDGLLSELVQAAQKAVERATKKAKKTY